MRKPSESMRDLFGLKDVGPPDFFASLSEVNAHAGTIPCTHIIRRAWKELDLSGVYCVRRLPTVYFKEVNHVNDEYLRDLHRRFWSQGVATLLVVVTPDQVHVLSSMARPSRPGESDPESAAVVETLGVAADALESLLERVRTGAFYRDKPASFKPEEVVDQYLLKNLTAARTALKRSLGGEPEEHIQTIHALLARVLFVCYLTDRGIIKPSYFDAAGAPGASSLKTLLNNLSDEAAHSALYKLFKSLQQTFNGSMFDDAIVGEQTVITAVQIRVLREFLNGEEVGEAQLSLFSWDYAFRIIPVETISAIYEDFLAFEDDAEKRESGAFYTPKLLAEMVVDVATEGTGGLLGKRCLDPACGSGIFLVILFNRMAEEWRHAHPNVSNLARANALIEILQTHLCGVDKKETACRIACFSLYLALLDQLDPLDIDQLRVHRVHSGQRVLPPLLALKREGYTKPKAPAVLEGSFFQDDLPVGSDFDLMIGNPPWVSRNAESAKDALDWCLDAKRNRYFADAKLHAKKKSDLEHVFLPSGQLAHAFMWKAPQHLNKSGKACLLVPSKAFLNKTDLFQAEWLAKCAVEKVVMLADWRFILFANAKCPATIVRFLPDPPGSDQQEIEYEVPKVARVDPRRGVIPVLSEDRKRLRVGHIIEEAREERAPALWKQSLWGSLRDLELLKKLQEWPRLGLRVGEPEAPRRWIRGQGFQPFHLELYNRNPKKYKEPKPRWWSDDHLYLDAKSKGIGLVLTKSVCREIGSVWPKTGEDATKLRRNPDRAIFRAPMVLTNQGFSKFAFSPFPVLFQDSLQAISGPPGDENLLMFLAAVLNSDLAKYFFFHTAANWGTERPKVHLWEILSLPFPLPEEMDDRSEAQRIVERVADRMKTLEKELAGPLTVPSQLLDKAKREIEPLVSQYFEVTERERIQVKDTVDIARRSCTPHNMGANIPTLRITNRAKRKAYADTLCEVLNGWMHRSPKRVSATAIVSKKTGTAILTLFLSGKALPYHEDEKTLAALEMELARLHRLLPRRSGAFEYERGLSVFEKDRLHILKPLEFRHWMRSTALDDADSIAGYLLSNGRNG